MSDHTPTPWNLCCEGKCSCLTISSTYFPIAKVTSGRWGDDYPSLRMIGGSIEGKFEAFMEQITYGEINPDLARANAKFIVKAVNAHDALVNALTELHAMAWSECPSLLNEDSGGSAHLDIAIREVLAAVGGSGDE